MTICPFTVFLSIATLGRILGHLRSGVRRALASFCCVSAVVEETERVPLAVVVAPPTRIIEGIAINWEVCKVDARCATWLLDSPMDTDVVFSTVWFAVDAIWYLEIAGANMRVHLG